MDSKRDDRLSDGEPAILWVLWDRGLITVGKVHKAMILTVLLITIPLACRLDAQDRPPSTSPGQATRPAGAVQTARAEGTATPAYGDEIVIPLDFQREAVLLPRPAALAAMHWDAARLEQYCRTELAAQGKKGTDPNRVAFGISYTNQASAVPLSGLAEVRVRPITFVAQEELKDLAARLTGKDRRATEESLPELYRLGGRARNIVPMLLPHIKAGKSYSEVLTVVHGLRVLGPHAVEAVPTLAEKFRTAEVLDKSWYALALGHIGAPAVATLERLLRQESDEIGRRAAAHGLARGDAAGRMALRAALGDPNADVRAAAVAELPDDSDREIRDLVVRLLADPSAGVRQAAAGKASLCEPVVKGQAVAALLGMLSEADERSQICALYGLGALHSRPEIVVPRLKPFLKTRGEASGQTRGAALSAVERFGPAAADLAPEVIACLDGDETQTVAALRALEAIGGKPAGAAAARVVALAASKNWGIADAATSTLFTVETDASAHAARVVSLLSDQNVDTRQRLAGQALAAMGPAAKGALPLLASELVSAGSVGFVPTEKVRWMAAIDAEGAVAAIENDQRAQPRRGDGFRVQDQRAGSLILLQRLKAHAAAVAQQARQEGQRRPTREFEYLPSRDWPRVVRAGDRIERVIALLGTPDSVGDGLLTYDALPGKDSSCRPRKIVVSVEHGKATAIREEAPIAATAPAPSTSSEQATQPAPSATQGPAQAARLPGSTISIKDAAERASGVYVAEVLRATKGHPDNPTAPTADYECFFTMRQTLRGIAYSGDCGWNVVVQAILHNERPPEVGRQYVMFVIYDKARKLLPATPEQIDLTRRALAASASPTTQVYATGKLLPGSRMTEEFAAGGARHCASGPVAAKAETDPQPEELGKGMFATVQHFSITKFDDIPYIDRGPDIVYSWLADRESPIAKGQTVIWFAAWDRGMKACADTPANRKLAVAAYNAAPERGLTDFKFDPRLLPGSKMTLDRAVWGSAVGIWTRQEALVAVVLEATEENVREFVSRAGCPIRTEKCKVIETLFGLAIGPEVKLRYERFDPQERPMSKGERFIWIAMARLDQPGQLQGIRALLDTPANRALVVSAGKAAGIVPAPTTQPATSASSGQAAQPATQPAAMEEEPLPLGEAWDVPAFEAVPTKELPDYVLGKKVLENPSWVDQQGNTHYEQPVLYAGLAGQEKALTAFMFRFVQRLGSQTADGRLYQQLINDLISRLDTPATKETADTWPAEFLGRLGARGVLRQMLGQRKDPFDPIGREMLTALSQVGDQRDVPLLIALARREDQASAALVNTALGHMLAAPPLPLQPNGRTDAAAWQAWWDYRPGKGLLSRAEVAAGQKTSMRKIEFMPEAFAAIIVPDEIGTGEAAIVESSTQPGVPGKSTPVGLVISYRLIRYVTLKDVWMGYAQKGYGATLIDARTGREPKPDVGSQGSISAVMAATPANKALLAKAQAIRARFPGTGMKMWEELAGLLGPGMTVQDVKAILAPLQFNTMMGTGGGWGYVGSPEKGVSVSVSNAWAAVDRRLPEAVWPIGSKPRVSRIEQPATAPATQPASTRPAASTSPGQATQPAATQSALQPATQPASQLAGDPRRGAVVTAEPDKAEYFLGENVLLHWCIRNAGDQPIKISIGGDGRTPDARRAIRFKVEAIDEQGKWAWDPYPNPDNFGGLGGDRTLEHGEQFHDDLQLMRYREAAGTGTYMIRVYHDLGWDRSDLPGSQAGEIPKAERLAPVAETRVRLVMPTAAQARQVVAEMLKLPTDADRTWGKPGKPFADFELLRYPVYLPIMKELAENGDTRGLDAIGAMAFPEATAALIELAENKNLAIAGKAMELLDQRTPSPWHEDRPSRHAYLADRSWNDQLRSAATTSAWKLLDGTDREQIIKAARLLQSMGGKDDLPALIKVMDRVLPAFKDDPNEQAAYLRPATASGSLVDAAAQIIRRGGQPPASPATPGLAVAFLVGLGVKGDFRPEGWRGRAVSLIDHQIPFIRYVALQTMPLPLDDAAIAAVARAIKDDFAPVQGAACDLAGKAQSRAFRQPLLDLLASTDNEWLVRGAFRAANECGAPMDRLLEICMARLGQNRAEISRVCYEQMINVLQYEGGYGGTVIEDWSDVAPALKKAWTRFIAANRDAIRAGKKFPIAKDPVVPAMISPGMQFPRKGLPPWPENDPPISEAGKGDLDAILRAVIPKLPKDSKVTSAAAGQVPQGWSTTDRAGVLVEGLRGAKPFGIYFMPADWIGVRKPDKGRPNPAGWDNHGILQGQGYKVIIRDVDVEICAALQKIGMRPPSLYRDYDYDIARRTYRRWDKKLDLSARAIIEKFCKGEAERNEAVRSLLDLGVPADGLFLEYAARGTEETRWRCMNCLPFIGGPQAKRIILDSLTDPNAAYYAGYALLSVADANDGPEIAAVLDRIPRVEAATAAARALAAIDYQPAGAVILERMNREENPSYKLEFAQTLASLRYKPAIPFIEKLCTVKKLDPNWVLSNRCLDILPEVALLRLTGDWGQEAEGGRLLLVELGRAAEDTIVTLGLLIEGHDRKYLGVDTFEWGYFTIDGKALAKVNEGSYIGPAGVPFGSVWSNVLYLRLDGPGPRKVQYHGGGGLNSNTLTLAAPGLATQPAARGASTRSAGTATAPARPTSSWQSPSATAPATQPATSPPATVPATLPAPSGPAAGGLTVGLAPQQPKVRFGDGLKIAVTLTNHGSKPIPIPFGSLRLAPSGWDATGSGGTGLGEDLRLPAEDGVVVPAGGYLSMTVTDREHTTIELGPINCQWRPVAGDAGFGLFKGEQEPIKIHFDVLPSQLMESAWSARTDQDRSKLMPEIKELLTLRAKSTDSRQRRLVEKTFVYLAGAAKPLLDLAARDDDPLVRAQAIEQYSHTAWAVGNMKAKQAAATQPGRSAEIGSWVKLVPLADEKAAADARIRVALAGLHDSEAVVRISAVRVLTWARHGPAEEVKRLAADPDARVRAVVQDYLSLFAGGAWSADTLIASLKDPNEPVRDKAIEALERSSQPPPLAELKAGFSASTGEPARRLLTLLYEQEDGNLPAALVKGFADRTEAEKIAILAAAAGHRDDATLEMAKLAMADSSPAVQRQGLLRLLPFPAGKAEAAMKEHLGTCPAELTPLAKAVGMELRQRAIFPFLANPSGWLAAAAEKKFPSANGTVPMVSPDGKWVAYVETGWGRPGGSGGTGRSNLTSLVHVVSVVSKDGKGDRIVSDMFLVGWLSDSRRIGSCRDGFAAVSDIDGNIVAEFGEKLKDEGIRPGNEWAKGELRGQRGVGMPHSKHVKAAGDYGEYAAFSPDGKWLGPIGRDKTFLSVAGEKTSVPGLEGADFPAAWSPDGNNVLVWGWKTAKVVNFVTRKTVAIEPVDVLPSLESWEYRKCRWNPWSHDGSHLAYLRDGQVWICRSDGLQARQLTWGGRAKAFPAFSPDGKRVAYLCYQPDNRRHYPRTGPTDLWVLDLDTGIETRLTAPGKGRIHCLDWLDGQTLIFDRLDLVTRGFASTLRIASLNETATAAHGTGTQPAALYEKAARALAARLANEAFARQAGIAPGD